MPSVTNSLLQLNAIPTYQKMPNNRILKKSKIATKIHLSSFHLQLVLRIRIRMDPHLKVLLDSDPDPDPGGKKA